MYIDFPPCSVVVEGADKIVFPPMAPVKQFFDPSKIDDPALEILSQMRSKITDTNWFLGKSICITVGSRGIPHLDKMVLAIIGQLKAWGAVPFIVPAMGSHGGATAQGQRELIAGYNITPETMGVEVKSSMEVVQYSALADGTPLYCDKYAYHSDGIVVLNKIKPHTNYHAKHESGLGKMIAIGLAKHMGASLFHMKGYATFGERIPNVCEEFLKYCPCVFGVAIIQNAYDEIYHVEIVEKQDIIRRDAELLAVAKAQLPAFKHPEIDVIIVDQIGKNISGNGYDPNVIAHDILSYQKLFVRGLTSETHHNACGLGGAEITTRRVLNDVDWNATWTNIITSTNIETGSIPLYMNSDKDALLVAIRTCVNIDYDRCKIVRVKDTLSMDHIWVSPAYWDCIKDRTDVRLLGDFKDMAFDGQGNFI